jgi:hypothetical protein
VTKKLKTREDSDHPDVIPSIEELIKCVKADAITSNCTGEMLERHRRVGALEIRKLLLKFGVKDGWRRVRMLFNRPVQVMTVLDRELTDDELAVLEGALGCRFDSSGYPRLDGREESGLREKLGTSRKK